MMKLFSPIVLFLSVLSAPGCKEKPPEEVSSYPQSQVRQDRKYDQAQDFNYTLWAINSDEDRRKAFKSKFSVAEIGIILSLNRIDKNHLGNVDTVVVPDTFDDWMAYAPFPFRLDVFADIPKMAIFSYPIQAYGLYEYGDLIKWGPSSLGKQTSLTPTGLFFTNWKGEEVQSTANDEWILKWNFNIENLQGVGWHEYALPGHPASSSCLRLLEADARWMYDWADEWILENPETVAAKGTPVLVFGAYEFTQGKPWLKLVLDPKANDIPKETLENLLAPHIDSIKKEQANRLKVLQSKPS